MNAVCTGQLQMRYRVPTWKLGEFLNVRERGGALVRFWGKVAHIFQRLDMQKLTERAELERLFYPYFNVVSHRIPALKQESEPTKDGQPP